MLEDRKADPQLSLPCRHGWYYVHCVRDDEGSHPGGTLLETDECYCGEAVNLYGWDAIIAYVDSLPKELSTDHAGNPIHPNQATIGDYIFPVVCDDGEET